VPGAGLLARRWRPSDDSPTIRWWWPGRRPAR